MQDNKNEYTEQDEKLTLNDLTAVSGGGEDIYLQEPINCPSCGQTNYYSKENPLSNWCRFCGKPIPVSLG